MAFYTNIHQISYFEKNTKTSKILTKYASKIYPQTYRVKVVKFQKFMYQTFEICLDFTVLEILLEIPCKRNTVMSIINFVILYAKRFIYCCKKYQKILSTNKFYASLRHSIKAEIYICKINSQTLNLSELNSAHINLWNICFFVLFVYP